MLENKDGSGNSEVEEVDKGRVMKSFTSRVTMEFLKTQVLLRVKEAPIIILG